MMTEDKFIFYRKQLDRVILFTSLICTLAILFHIGYNRNNEIERLINAGLEWCFYFFAVALSLKTLTAFKSRSAVTPRVSEAILCFYFVAVTLIDNYHFAGAAGTKLVKPEWIYLGIFAVLVVEVSKQTLFFDQFYFNPTLLFVLSFLLLIIVGTALLLLPNSAVHGQLHFVDALFLAASSVCITGLSGIDVANDLTRFGQTVVLVLVQVGGLGIMTFTGFFGYFFSGGFSYKNQLMFTELIGENKVGSVISTLYKIVFVTFLLEFIGAVLIYFTLDNDMFISSGEKFYATIFHAITAFCNAGFSIFDGGLTHPYVKFNYPFQLGIIWLYIMGGLGFLVIFNFYELVSRFLVSLYHRIFFKRPIKHRSVVIAFNSKIIGYTTLCLIIAGFLFSFFLEYNYTLREHESGFGKAVTALFIGTSPRSSGFNTVPMEGLAFSTVMIILLLMWIGAAPGSTGGGIKVTTFAVAALNIGRLARGKDSIEVAGRMVSEDSVARALGIITLSLLFLGLSIFALTVTDPEKTLLSLAFESFSAFTTTGLSLGITPRLSDAGKLVVILTMFIGRVGSMTLLIALVKKAKPENYHLPAEQVNL
ncbi:TrkH family potassium uptake protein [Dyadobacter sandarakinus]|uniref:ATPase n=1 Tax=Dyadobacter sandarakinus TaxID=2747268 RepID=A0ABX7I412_9BACT|nr:potassium transporter TrkG [Dyadobacter sandarakinus]QRR00826.1 ATPase [Dyadobacter sandarakinus]